LVNAGVCLRSGFEFEGGCLFHRVSGCGVEST
jgi:hypothetical protein